MNIHHRVDRPFEAGSIEVFGDDPVQWRILDHAGHLVRDSTGNGRDTGYDSPTLALRDAIAFDADDNVVPIFFRHTANPELENAAQVHRIADVLRGMVAALKSASSQAVLDSRHATDDEAQDYLDARIEVIEGIVQELEGSVERLRAIHPTSTG